MAKKPSEWTPQEAVEWAKEEAAQICDQEEQPYAARTIRAIQFPADQPEVVSDAVLARLVGYGSSVTLKEVEMMARELLARREAERKP